jgi:hypothetical protein
VQTAHKRSEQCQIFHSVDHIQAERPQGERSGRKHENREGGREKEEGSHAGREEGTAEEV